MNEASTTELMTAIRKKCHECSGKSWDLVTRCNIKDCPLYPYRVGESKKKSAKGVKLDQMGMELDAGSA